MDINAVPLSCEIQGKAAASSRPIKPSTRNKSRSLSKRNTGGGEVMLSMGSSVVFEKSEGVNTESDVGKNIKF
jgi:hypothetical protein